MNLSEFKAWFEGFTEGLDGRPTEKQWARIQEKIGQIKDAPPTSYPVFVRDYWRPYWRANDLGGPTFLAAVAQSQMGQSLASNDAGAAYQNAAVAYSAGDSFRALGRAEASEMDAVA